MQTNIQLCALGIHSGSFAESNHQLIYFTVYKTEGVGKKEGQIKVNKAIYGFLSVRYTNSVMQKINKIKSATNL